MALRGITVIELAGLAPVPFCGMVLADFGARVIRIDKIGSNPKLDCLGHGKQSVAFNMKHPQAVHALKLLCKESDVLIEPYRPGVMEKLGLGPNVLLKDNPKLIYARLTGFSQTGPYSKAAGHDINYLALSGLLSIFGRSGQKPSFPVNFASDFAGGGLICALGIILALFERKSSGLGQIIDSNMVEGTSYLGSWLYRSQDLPIWGEERGKNWLDSGSHFYDVYETKDKKYMAVGALEAQFYENLLLGLGVREEDAFQMDDFEVCKKLFTEKFLEKTQREWCDIFDKLDACVSPVLELHEAPQHVHNKEIGSFSKTDDGYIPNPAPRLSRTPAVSVGVTKLANRGEHTRAVLKHLNYTDKQIDDLENEGAIECYKNSKL